MGDPEGSFLHRADARSLAVSGAIWLIGPGLGVVPCATEDVRNLAARRRELALRWSAGETPGPPGPPPQPSAASRSARSWMDQ